MKKYFIGIYSFLLTLLIITGCGQKETKITSEQIDTENLQSVDLKEENVSLLYKMKKGDKFSYKLTTFSNTIEKIKTDSLISSISDQKVTYVFDIQVLEVDEDKTSELSITINSLNLEAEFNGNKISYDADKELTEDDKMRFGQYAAIHKIPYRARVTNYGDVLEVTRLEKMVDKLNSFQPEQQKFTTEQKSEIIKNMAEGALRPITQLIFRVMPQKPIAKDSFWVKTSPAQLSIFNVENIAKYTVKDFVKVKDDNAARISAELTFKYEGEKKGEHNGMKYAFDEPKLRGEGNILFNLDKGLLLKAETSTTIEIAATIEAKDAMQKTQKVIRTDISKNKNIVELL